MRGAAACAESLALRYVIFGGEALELDEPARPGSSATATPRRDAGQHVRHHRDDGARHLSPDSRPPTCAARRRQRHRQPHPRPAGSTCSTRTASRCRSACRARSTSAAPASPAAISNRPELTAERFVADPVRRRPGRTGSTAPATWPAACPTATSSTSAAATSRSRSAASASSSARSRPRSPQHPRVREAVVVAREAARGDARAGRLRRRRATGRRSTTAELRALPRAASCRRTWCRRPSCCSTRCR